MATRRIAANQSVQAGFEGGPRYRFHSSITPSPTIETTTSRPFGSKDATDVSVTKEEGSAAIAGDNIQAAELRFLLAASIGNEVDASTVEDTAAGLVRTRYNNLSFEPVTNRELVMAAGEPGRAETLRNALLNELTLSVNKAAGTNSVSGTLVGKALDVDAVYSNEGVVLLPSAPLSAGKSVVQIGTVRPTFTTPLANPADGLEKVSYEWTFGGLFEADYLLDGNGPSPAGFLASLERTAGITVWVSANDKGVDLLRSLRNSQQLFSTLRIDGPGGVQLTVINSVKVQSKDANETSGGKYGSNFGLLPVYNSDMGGSTMVELVSPALPEVEDETP